MAGIRKRTQTTQTTQNESENKHSRKQAGPEYERAVEEFLEFHRNLPDSWDEVEKDDGK